MSKTCEKNEWNSTAIGSSACLQSLVLVIARQSQGNGRCQNGNVIFPFFHLNPMGVGEGKSLAGCPGDALAASPKRKLAA
jgi:hypothetical protein